MNTLLKTMKTFQQKKNFGEEGEKQVLEYLTNVEMRYCLPMYQFEPKQAPIWMTPVGQITAPDIITVDGYGKTIFAECKRKNSWVVGYREDSLKETGIDTRLWIKYMALVNNTGIPLELYFLHEEGITEQSLYRITITKELLDEFRKNHNIFRIGSHLKNGLVDARLIHFPYELLKKLY